MTDYPDGYEPLFGALFTCDHCEGYGAIVGSNTASHWDMEPSNDEWPCPTCNGTGQIWVEEGC